MFFQEIILNFGISSWLKPLNCFVIFGIILFLKFCRLKHEWNSLISSTPTPQSAPKQQGSILCYHPAFIELWIFQSVDFFRDILLRAPTNTKAVPAFLILLFVSNPICFTWQLKCCRLFFSWYSLTSSNSPPATQKRRPLFSFYFSWVIPS